MHKKKDIKLIVFDVDGVLINSLDNMNKSWTYVSNKYQLNKKFSTYKKYIGLPFYDILKKMKIKANHKQIFSLYNKVSKDNLKSVKFYDNVKITLRKLKKKNILTALFTSKNLSRIKLILNKINFKFNLVITPEKVKKGKPNPEGLNIIKKKFLLKSKNILYIGDTYNDYLAAKKSGVKYLHADWGYGKANKNCIKIKNIKELFKFI